MSCAITDEPTEMPFEMTRVSSSYDVLDRSPDLPQEGQF